MPLLDPARLKSVLGPVAGRFAVTALAECDSTSSELMRRADAGAVSGAVVVADRQLTRVPQAEIALRVRTLTRDWRRDPQA